MADSGNRRVKKMTPSGMVAFVADNGVAGFADGPAQVAQFRNPVGVCVDGKGNAYIADFDDHRIRRISAFGEVTTYAGSGVPGYPDDARLVAQFNMPNDLALDSSGNLYVTEFQNNTVRKVTPAGVVSTWAGNGTVGFQDGIGTAARFNQPGGIAINSFGNLFVSEWGGNRIRQITPRQAVSTLAGNGAAALRDGQGRNAQFQNPDGIVVGTGRNIYIADNRNHAIRRLEPSGYVWTIAGTGTLGFVDGPGLTVQFGNPSGIGWGKDGALYVTDGLNHAVRQVAWGLTNGSSVVLRRLPAQYVPGHDVVVTLEAHPPADMVSFAIEDRAPAGWTFANADAGGVFDSVNSKVKFGPFFDNRVRALTYVLRAPGAETGAKQFSGTVSSSGSELAIAGDSVIEMGLLHPADLAPADRRLSNDEMTAYAIAWKNGTAWPAEPKVIPISYLTRAGGLSTEGEAYRYDGTSGSAPLRWVSTGAGSQPTRAPYQVAAVSNPVINDLWDINQGAVVRASSPTLLAGSPARPMDPRDLFGGTFSGGEQGFAAHVMFADGFPDNYVHYVEWTTPVPVIVRSFNLWANGDGSLQTREMGSFRLLAKSPGASEFDLVLYAFTPTHPYTYADGIGPLLIKAEITPVTAYQFRAEFGNWNALGMRQGPRVIELDGFGEAAPPGCTRTLPALYVPGQMVSVVLEAHPPAGRISYAIEEGVPAGWAFLAAKEGGTFDSAHNKLRFGPFFDPGVKVLAYSLRAPSGETGVKLFNGTFSNNGSDSAIQGPGTLPMGLLHPADVSPADWRININEVTAYGAAWRKGTAWPVEPRLIPIGYVTRAGTLWRSGEAYRYDPSAGTDPMWWVSSGAGPKAACVPTANRIRLAGAGVSTAVSEMPLAYVPNQPVLVQIRTQPAASVMSFAVEDQPPAG